MYSRSWVQLPVLSMRGRGLSFASLVSSLAILSRSWVESKDKQMVSGSLKFHEVWRVS